jgi:hypothetical protein
VGLILGYLMFIALLHYITRTRNGGLRGLLADARLGIMTVPGILAARWAASLVPPGIPEAAVASTTYLLLLTVVGSRLGLTTELTRLIPLLRTRLQPVHQPPRKAE